MPDWEIIGAVLIYHHESLRSPFTSLELLEGIEQTLMAVTHPPASAVDCAPVIKSSLQEIAEVICSVNDDSLRNMPQCFDSSF
jgi:hypothetical protein